MELHEHLNRHPNYAKQLKAALGEPEKALVMPLTTKIKLLWQCNLRCSFCQIPSSNEILSLDLLQKQFELLLAAGLHKLHLSGGEVFLYNELENLLALAQKAGVQLNITTNGTLINKERARLLVNRGVHSVTISIDAPFARLHDKLRGRKGAFKDSINGIKMIARYRKLRRKPYLRVNTVVTNDNAAHLQKMYELLKELAVVHRWKLIWVDSARKKDRLHEQTVIQVFQQLHQWQDLLDLRELPLPQDKRSIHEVTRGKYGKSVRRHKLCYAPWFHAFIDPAGYVYPCCMSRGHGKALGNIYENSISEIYQGASFRKVRRQFLLGNLFAVCAHCDDFIKENQIIETLHYRA